MRGIQYAIISYGHIAFVSGGLYIVLNMNIRTTTVCYVERVLVRPAGTHSASQFTGVSSFARSLKAARVQNSGDPGRCFPSSELRPEAYWYVSPDSAALTADSRSKWKNGVASKVAGTRELRERIEDTWRFTPDSTSEVS